MEKKVTIYMIKCKNQEIKDFYIGSTCDYEDRKREHYNTSMNPNKRAYKYKLYEFIRNNGNFDNFKFVVLNEIDFHNKPMQNKQEQCYITQMKPSLNTYRAYITKEEKSEVKKLYEKTDKCKEVRKLYEKTDKCKEIKKKYAKTDKFKETQKIYKKTEKCKEIQKIYAKTDKAKEYRRNYYLIGKYKKWFKKVLNELKKQSTE